MGIPSRASPTSLAHRWVLAAGGPGWQRAQGPGGCVWSCCQVSAGAGAWHEALPGVAAVSGDSPRRSLALAVCFICQLLAHCSRPPHLGGSHRRLQATAASSGGHPVPAGALLGRTNARARPACQEVPQKTSSPPQSLWSPRSGSPEALASLSCLTAPHLPALGFAWPQQDSPVGISVCGDTRGRPAETPLGLAWLLSPKEAPNSRGLAAAAAAAAWGRAPQEDRAGLPAPGLPHAAGMPGEPAPVPACPRPPKLRREGGAWLPAGFWSRNLLLIGGS